MEFSVKLTKKQKIARDTYSFFFTPNQQIKIPDFFPGQYLNLTLQIHPTDGKGSSRFFSIASSPTEEFLMITTRRGNSDFKNALFNLALQSEIKVTMPIGGFYLREEDKRQRIFLAGGIGITVFRSMVHYIVDKNLTIPVTLLASFSIKEDEIFHDELMHLAKGHKNIQIIYHFGRISETVIKENIQNSMDASYMVAGPPAMADDISDVLLGLGVLQENIQLDQFTGY